MSSELSKTLKLEVIGKETFEDDNNKSKEISWGKVDHIGIGNLDFSDIICATDDFKRYNDERCIAIQGIIGTNLLAKAIWQFDFQNQKITITNDKKSLDFAPDKKIIPFNLDSANGLGVPIIKLRNKGNYICDAYLAIGWESTISLPKGIHKMLSDTLPKLVELSLDSIITKKEANVTKTPNLAIDNIVSLAPYWVWDSSTKDYGYIGNGVFSDFVITLDWMAREATFSNQRKVETACPTVGYRTNSKLIVNTLFKNSPADKAGLMLGDKILDYDGKDVSNLTEEQFCEWGKTFEQKNKIKLKVQRKDKIFEITLESVYFDSFFSKN